MNQTFTQNDLLTLIYDENDCCTNVSMKNELVNNKVLSEEFREMKRTISLLDQHQFSPKESSCNTILNYSRQKINKEVLF